MVTRVKICGITRFDDAIAALESGAHAIGFVFDPASPRFVGDDADLLEKCCGLPWISKVAVFGELPPRIPESARLCDTLQWVAGERPDGLSVGIRAVRLREGADLDPCDDADAVLLDAYHASKFGGTGEQVDWQKASQIVAAESRPVILAGGLEPSNVADAVRAVRPFGVDVSSGVEASPGVKDPKLVRAFCRAVQAG